MNVYCQKCGQPNHYGSKKPKFCSHCGESFGSTPQKTKKASNRGHIQKQLGRAAQSDDEENEVTSVPNIDKLDVEIEAPKAAGVTIGQIAGTNPEDATVDEAGPTKQAPQPSPEEVMSDLQREAGTLRQQGKGNA
tara:strand:- start:2667 stop:3071 length:405 start_codon:yes stop_codon:yes gene_type:complete